MSTKDRLLLENDDHITWLLFTLSEKRQQVLEQREQFPDDQAMQLEFDRMDTYFQSEQRRLRRIKEQTAKL